MNQVRNFPAYLPNIRSNIFPSTLRSSEMRLPFRFSDQNVCISYRLHVCYMSRPSHPPFYHRNNMWWSTDMLLILNHRAIIFTRAAPHTLFLKVPSSLILYLSHYICPGTPSGLAFSDIPTKILYDILIRSRGKSVSRVTMLRAGRPGFDSRKQQGRNFFLFDTASR